MRARHKHNQDGLGPPSAGWASWSQAHPAPLHSGSKHSHSAAAALFSHTPCEVYSPISPIFSWAEAQNLKWLAHSPPVGKWQSWDLHPGVWLLSPSFILQLLASHVSGPGKRALGVVLWPPGDCHGGSCTPQVQVHPQMCLCFKDRGKIKYSSSVFQFCFCLLCVGCFLVVNQAFEWQQRKSQPVSVPKCWATGPCSMWKA